MRVAHFLPHYPGRDGSAAFCRGLSHALNRLEPASCPILTLRSGPFRSDPGEDLLHYPNTKSRNPFKLPEKLLSDLAENAYDLDGVVLHGTFNPPMATLGKHLRKHRIPYLFIPHDPYVKGLLDHHKIRKSIYWHVFEKNLIQGAAAVQLLDSSHEVPLRQMGCDVRTVIIPNGCDPEMLHGLPADARVPGARTNDVRLLYFGRMDRNHKGLDLLLKGFAKAVAKEPALMTPTKLVMTGNDWTDRTELECLATALGLKERVEFTGRRPECAMAIVAEADLVILPSRFDGFGLCIVEAMLAGRPVIVSKAAGVAGHVAEAGGGWLTEPDVDKIAEALVTAMTNKKNWEAMGRKNSDHVMEHLTWEQIAMKTRDAYASVFGIT